MASVITATTTSGIVSSADNSGTLQLASGSGNLVTIPAVTGTAMVSGNIPAFAAYVGSGATISNNTNTKVAFNTKIFDTANCYDATTNYRYTPNVAGYYQVNVCAMLYSYSAAAGITYVSARKNGTIVGMASAINAIAAQENGIWCCPVVYMNGTTDYLEAYVYQNSGGNASLDYGTSYSYFGATLVRAA